MNFLAHLALSDRTGPAMIGNLLADFIRGRQIEEFPEPVRRGVYQHRKVDAFTDQHEAWKHCVALIRPEWKRYAFIIVDVVWDYYLARNWDALMNAPLDDFLVASWKHMEPHRVEIPERAAKMLDRLGDGRLGRSGTVPGITEALARVERRLSRPVPLSDSMEDVLKHDAEYNAAFLRFFPDAQAHSRGLAGA